MGKRKELHKYHFIPMKYTKVWACALPDCLHYIPKHMEYMVCGKRSICWSCDKEFILNEENMKDDQPICETCKIGAENLKTDLDSDLETALAALINNKK
jgi:hypothetical protein